MMCDTHLPAPSPRGGRPQKYCSNACRQRAKRRRKRDIPLMQTLNRSHCEQCGVAIESNAHGEPKRFCGATCRKRFSRHANDTKPHLTGPRQVNKKPPIDD